MADPKLSDARVLVITGAGISAESGIATFRGPGGYWRKMDPAKLATEAAFRSDPALVWEWYRERREQIRGACPNAAHIAVVELAATAGDFLLVTQNVDDLHLRAKWNGRALAPELCVQIHGDIFVTRCSRCDYRTTKRLHADDAASVPVCPRCEIALRPGVVWFGESLPPNEVQRVEAFLDGGRADVTIVIGTTALFGYIVEWAVRGRRAGGELVEINPEETPLSPHATRAIRGAAAAALPGLVAEWSHSGLGSSPSRHSVGG
ncbi:MAG: Sir2 family NAD-dependent protein deacetylase [Opitutaceae bacterium]|nr:Sir2 family NAD-dependent protein deacetylase [Opitutaceae bacterium]